MSSKNIVIINPDFPEWKYDFIKALCQLGNPCLGITSKESDLPLADFKWLSKVDFSGSAEKNFTRFSQEINSIIEKFGKIDHIESFEEYWKPLESKLRNNFLIEGRVHLEYDIIASKYHSKKLFLNSDVKVVNSIIPNNLAESREFFRECNNKIIAKHEFGVSSQGFNKIFSHGDLNKLDLSKTILEEYLEGEIFSYDALVDKIGSPVASFCLNYKPLDKVLTDESELAIFVLKNMPEEIDKIGKRCIKQFKCKNEFIHLEFMKHNGEFYGMDANIRICGAYANYLYNIVSNSKIEDLWAKSVLGLGIEENIEYNNFAGLFTRRNSKQYKLSEGELKKELSKNLIYIKSFPQIASDCLNDTGYFIRTDTLEELESIKSLIQAYK